MAPERALTRSPNMFTAAIKPAKRADAQTRLLNYLVSAA